MASKKCSKCNILQNIEQFSKDKTKKDGYRPSCKICKQKTDKTYRNQHQDEIKSKGLEYRKEHREEANKRAKEWYSENRDYSIECRRKHYRENKNRYKVWREKWKSENIDFLKIYHKDYHRIRKAKDPDYAIRCSLRNRFTSALISSREFNKYFEYLSDCNMEFIKNWLQSNFEEGFSWENHGSVWHIDHIVPVSFYDLTNEENLLLCFHWSNIRPCTKEENLNKSNKIIPEIIQTYKIKALLYHLKSSVPTIE